MTDRITELALQAGAARFYPDRQAVTPDSYLVGQEFLQRFAELVRNDALDEAAELADEHKHSCYEGDIDWSKTMTCNERVPQANMEQPAVEPVHPRHPAVVRWRNDGIEACAGIADRYGNADAASDMRAMLTEAPQPQPLVVEPVAEVLECGNLYAKVKLLGDAWGSTSVGDKFYAAPQPQQPAINQCDGCRSGQELRGSLHVDRHGKAVMVCQADKYPQKGGFKSPNFGCLDQASMGKSHSSQQPECNPHPDAPHGFDRDRSHSLGRYVCDCDGWMP